MSTQTASWFFTARVFRAAAAITVLAFATAASAQPSSSGGIGRETAARTVFSDSPTDEEFLRAGLFVQPLIPVGITTHEENRHLASALTAYAEASRKDGRDSVRSLLSFLADNPESPWTPILQVCLGAIYRRTGHFSKALEIWQQAWDGSRNYKDVNGRAVADIAAAYLSQFEAYLGRKETLGPRLDELRKRPLRGAAAELISESAGGLADMLTRPNMAFKCGPSALSRILTVKPTPNVARSRQILTEAESTPRGISLTAVQAISVDAGMGYQMAYRSPGAPLIIPAVAHWKVGHYAALLGQQAGRLLVGDTTFGEDIMMRPSTLDEEASGYFLVASGALPDGWRRVDAVEGNTVWGRGDTGANHDNGATGCQEIHAFGGGGCSTCGGCSTWNVEAMVDGLSLHDDLIGYHPPVGPDIRFPMDYSQRDMQQPIFFTYINFGNKWTTGWLSYVIDDAQCAGFYGDAVTEPPITIPGGPAVILRTPAPLSSPPAPAYQATPIVTGTFCSSLYRRGGGSEPYVFLAQPGQSQFNPALTATSPIGQFSQASMTRNVDVSGNVTSYVRNLPNGSIERFTLRTAFGASSQFFMTEVDDPQGNAVKIAYDNLLRIVSLTDAIGQVTTLCYNDSYLTQPKICSQPAAATNPNTNLEVTQVTDPFGRSAYFGYDPVTAHLTSITDVLGIKSSFTYTSGSDFINTLTTPYGSTQFAYTDALSENIPTDTSRSVTITDALGGISRVEYRQGGSTCNSNNVDVTSAPGYSILCKEPEVPNIPLLSNSNQQYRNTFIWNPVQYAASYNTSNRYQGGRLIHWLHTDNYANTSLLTSSRVPESAKEPLESRVWFGYPGQAQNDFPSSQNTMGVGAINLPSFVARVLDDKTTQMWQYQYNASGKLTQSIDPANRQLTMIYAANGIDLMTVTNTTPITGGTQRSDLLLSLGNYNSQHEPQQVTRANGQTIKLTYNAAGQLLSSTDPLNTTWKLTYSSASGGYLQTIVGPAAPQVPQYALIYDVFGRVSTSQGPDGRLLTYTYDAANRLTSTLFPDQTKELLGYTNLDLTSFTDRRKNQTSRKYDAKRELIEIDEPAGRTTKLAYGPDGVLNSITDPLASVTSYATDAEGRLVTINYPDGTHQWRTYDGSGRLLSFSPSQSQPTVQYAYNIDNSVAEIQANQVTPTFFTYDPAYRRLTGWVQSAAASGSPILSQETMSYGAVGGLGANKIIKDVTTQTDSTHPASGPNVTTSNYSYDQLDRLASWSVTPGAASAGNPTEKWSYDPIGRIIQDSNLMGTFSYSYSDATARVSKRANSSGGPTLTASYNPAAADGLLQQITYTATAGATLGQYSYTYDANHNVTSFTESDPTVAESTAYTYDPYNQLVSAARKNNAPVTSGALSISTQYSYDLSGNLLSNVATTTFAASPAVVTSVTTKYGLANEITTSTVSDPAETSAIPGTYDAAGNGDLLAAGANYLAAPNGPWIPGVAGGYTYDAFNRLVQVSNHGFVANFTYDGIGRLIQVVDSGQAGANRIVSSNYSYAWCGSVRCVEINDLQQVTPAGSAQAVGTPDKIYFTQGSAPPAGGASSYELTDALGSVRGMVSGNAIVAEYDYDPLGNRSTVTGTAPGSDRGFAGYYYHAETNSQIGLQFAQYRVYSAALGRWLTRDPIGNEYAFANRGRFNATDLNLYAYVGNNPASLRDPSGYHDIPISWGDAAGGALALPTLANPVTAAWALGVLDVAAFLLDLAQDPLPDSSNDWEIGDSAGGAYASSGSDTASDDDDGQWDTYAGPEAGTVLCSKEHTKNARPSSEERHQKGRARTKRDYGGEKGDDQRGFPRQRPKDWKGQWPPQQQ